MPCPDSAIAAPITTAGRSPRRSTAITTSGVKTTVRLVRNPLRDAGISFRPATCKRNPAANGNPTPMPISHSARVKRRKSDGSTSARITIAMANRRAV